MIALIDGVEGNVLDIFKASNRTLNIICLDDNGAQLALTGGTVDLLIYTYEDRREAVTDTVSCALTDAAAGHASAVFVPADLNYGPQLNNAPYWAYVKFTESGGTEHLSRTPSKINIK